MSYVVVNAITVPAGNVEEFERRFAARAGKVESSPGFEAFELLRPANDAAGDRYLVYTRWDSKRSFEGWMSSKAFTEGHARPEGPEGARPAGSASEVLMYEVIQREERAPE